MPDPIQEVQDDPNAVSIDTTTPPTDDSVSLPVPGVNEQPLPPEIAQQRANKTSQGLGDVMKKNTRELYQEFLDGQEDRIRRQAASDLDFKKAMDRQQEIQDLASKQGAPLMPEQVEKVMAKYQPADPAMVIERAYATNYVSSLNTAAGYMSDSNPLYTAVKEVPKEAENALIDGSELLTKNQYILSRMQNLQVNSLDKQSTIGWVADQAKMLAQPYLEYKQRGLIGSATAGIGLGNNLDEAHYTLYRQPLPEFKKSFDTAMDYLEKDNPSLALAYANSLLSQSTFTSALNNTFTAMALPDIYAGMKGIGKLAGMVSARNQVRKAARDIVESAARDPNATPATAAEGAGNLSEAAVQRVTARVEAALQGSGNPMEAAQEALLSTWREDAARYAANPGTYLARELTIRITDGFLKAGEQLLAKIGTMNRVERTPVAVTSEDVIRAYKDKIRFDYKGPNNTIANIEGPLREPVSGTYWYRTDIVNYDGTQFSTKETAEGFAHQIGLSTPDIRGTSPDKLYIPQTAAKNLESVETKNGTTRFFVDNHIEVESTPSPQPGHVPYNLSTGKFEKALTEESAHVEQQGLGFHIQHWTPMQENGNLVRDHMIKTPHGEAIKEAVSTNSASGINQIKNSLLGWVRSSDDTLSTNESAQRKAVTYTQANIQRWAQDLRKDIEDVAAGRVREDPVTGEPISPLVVHPKTWFGKISSRKVAQQFERTLDNARYVKDPVTGEDGYFFKTGAELQDYYLRNFDRSPSYLETKSYFNYTKLIEGDRMMAEVAEFRNRARIGSEQHQILSKNADGTFIKSPVFDGIRETEFPGGDEYILVMGDKHGDETLHQLGKINDAAVKGMREKVLKGEAQVIRIYDRDHQPLSDFSEVAKDKLISYVYSSKVDTKPLAFNHVNRRAGGHFEWDYDWYIKQADVRPQHSGGIADKRPGVEHMYVGDITVMPIKNRKIGQNVAKLWNEIHELIKQDRWNDARPIVAKLGIEWQEFASWYHPGRDAEGRVTRARFNPNEPMVVVQKNKKISQLSSDLENRYRIQKPDGKYKSTFKDATKSGPANNFKVAYNSERRSSTDTMRTIDDVGTQGNPVYAHQPAEMIDPLTTMNRALNRAISSTFMDDYKFYAVEHWLREAEPHMEASAEEIRSSPFWHYNNPKWRSGLTDKTVIWNLESNKYKIDQFIGVPSKADTWIHSMTTQLADNAYEGFGPEGSRSLAQKSVSIAPIWALHRLKDPVSFIRAVTFNFKLGLGAIPQFLVQAQTHALIWALEPRYGTSGTYAMMLHGWSKFNKNPAILDALDNYATKLNVFGSKWRPGEWKEAMSELDKSGFEHVAGEYSNLDDQLRTKFIMNDFEKGLKLGQAPFRLGEQSTRVSAWYTAFREFRDANPTTPITNIERSKILSKADLLTVNMSRASASMLNHGALSLSTQFLTYQIKLAELFWGKRLGETLGERMMARARIIGLFSVLYGVPNAIGVTGAPFSDNVREHFMDDLGYIPGEKFLSTFINEGLPAWSLAMITGRGDLQKGNLENVGDRYGSQGFQNWKQALRSDIPWWQVIGGASTATFAKFINSAFDPFYQGALSWARGDTGDSRFTIRSADLVEPLKEISSISAGTKWWSALSTGKWISKNESYVTDVSPLRATLLGLTGMSPQDQDDMFITNKMVAGETDAQKAALKEFIKDWRRGIEAKQNNDDEQGNAYHRNAMARLTSVGYPYEKILSAIAIANKGYEKAIDNANYRSWQQGDRNKQPQRLERYKRQIELNDKRAQ